MSDRLAISAMFSVLMMASYVLFSGDAVRAPIGSSAADLAAASAAGLGEVQLPRAGELLSRLR